MAAIALLQVVPIPERLVEDGTPAGRQIVVTVVAVVVVVVVVVTATAMVVVLDAGVNFLLRLR